MASGKTNKKNINAVWVRKEDKYDERKKSVDLEFLNISKEQMGANIFSLSVALG